MNGINFQDEKPPRRDPIAWVELEKDRTVWQWRVLSCPYCWREHVHGGGGLNEDPRDYLGHRIAHCSGGRGGGYWLREIPPGECRPAKPKPKPKPRKTHRRKYGHLWHCRRS